jgi:hypothetical protein
MIDSMKFAFAAALTVAVAPAAMANDQNKGHVGNVISSSTEGSAYGFAAPTPARKSRVAAGATARGAYGAADAGESPGRRIWEPAYMAFQTRSLRDSN